MGHLIVNLYVGDDSDIDWEGMGMRAPKNGSSVRRAILKTVDIKHIQETDDPVIQKIVYYDDLDIASDLIQGSFQDVCAAYIRADSGIEIEEPEEEES